MQIVFVSNFFNHHQKPLCDALYARTGGQFRFIATAPMPSARRELGYGREPEPEYVISAFAGSPSRQRCTELIAEADVVIFGSAPESLLRPRIRLGKLIFRYSERPLKDGCPMYKFLPRLIRWNWRNPPGKPIYLLCASAFAAADYARFGLFLNKAYQWGYFPETIHYVNPASLLRHKDPTSILWVARFLELKRPGDVLLAARRLKQEGYAFTLTMIGRGPEEGRIRRCIREYGLEDCVRLTGSMTPEEVRRHMEKAGIFLFTSDRNEGWGAVVNEAMNSGCAFVGSHVIGSVPFLVCHGENGLVYPSENVDALYSRIKYLLDHPAAQRRLGAEACRTITEQWNADTAAARLLELSRRLLAGEISPDLYAAGPCSRSPMIREDWYNG